MRRFGKPQKPFYIVLSKDDKALWLSRTIGGGVTRVGDNPNTAELAALGATVIDLTDVKGNDSTNHDKFDQLAAVAPQLRSVLAGGSPQIPALPTWAEERHKAASARSSHCRSRCSGRRSGRAQRVRSSDPPQTRVGRRRGGRRGQPLSRPGGNFGYGRTSPDRLARRTRLLNRIAVDGGTRRMRQERSFLGSRLHVEAFVVVEPCFRAASTKRDSVGRVPAMEIERRVAEAVQTVLSVADRQHSIGSQSGQRRTSRLGAPADFPAPREACGFGGN